MARTDLHRPSTIVPANYRFVGMNYYGPQAEDIYSINEGRKAIRADMDRTGGHYAHVEHGGFGGGSCDVCGAHALYVGVFHYAQDNTYVVLGHDCVAKLELAQIDSAAFRKEVKRGIEAIAGKKKAQATLAAADLSRAWDIYNMTFEQLLASGGVTVKQYRPSDRIDGQDNTYHDYSYEEQTIRDIVRKLIGWGSLSEKQTEFLRNLLAKIDKREALKVQRAAEAAAAKPLPKFEGRVQITGKILTTKQVESCFGYRTQTVTKILVQHADGWKVWGSLPSGLDADKGDTISFFAKVEPGKDDPKFGFFSRPTKATVVERKQAQEAA